MTTTNDNHNNIEKACEELKQALLETVNLDQQAQDIKLLQIKAQKRLSLARDIVHNIKLN